MVRHVFFSFKYNPDVWRANSIRNQMNVIPSWAVGFYDDSINEQSFAQSENYIKDKIKKGLKGTSVTVILITSTTYKSKYVKYEYEKSVEAGKGILLLHVEDMEDRNRLTETKGTLPYADEGISKKWYSKCPLGDWIEAAYNA